MPPSHIAAIDAFWGAHADAGRPGARFALRRPADLVRALAAVRRLPRVDVRPSASPGGDAVRAVLRARIAPGVPGRLLGSAALAVPEVPGAYLEGRRAQTLRRKVRAARAVGTHVEPVDCPEERQRLLDLVDRLEREHPDPVYRVDEPANDDLLDHDLWLVARDPAGTPMLLSVTPVDGELAVLRYFRTLGYGTSHSDARYLATVELVTRLAERGVRWLLDTEPISAQTSGLRHFQKMVGFGYARFRLRRRGSRSPALPGSAGPATGRRSAT
ncbi:unannotated protein [freshwater metagenome]|uniref:Unannotated protein n=1 Tax=freshwater metagenome TaxID=449393 RepID=A0A6J6T816_9ZZZZ|nr:hypothetical protein [Actinomycetota bacterium]